MKKVSFVFLVVMLLSAQALADVCIAVPEMDPSSVVGGIILLAGSLAIIVGRKRSSSREP